MYITPRNSKKTLTKLKIKKQHENTTQIIFLGSEYKLHYEVSAQSH